MGEVGVLRHGQTESTPGETRQDVGARVDRVHERARPALTGWGLR